MTKRIYNQPEVNIAQIAALSIICASGGGSSTPDPGEPLSTFTPGATTNRQLQARRIYQRSVVNGSTLQLIATCIQGKGIHPSVLACFFFVLRRLVDDIENFFSVRATASKFVVFHKPGSFWVFLGLSCAFFDLLNRFPSSFIFLLLPFIFILSFSSFFLSLLFCLPPAVHLPVCMLFVYYISYVISM